LYCRIRRVETILLRLQLKRAKGIMHSQRIASIALSVIECIDYLAYGTFFTRAVFPFVAKDSARKAGDEPREVVPKLSK